MGETREREVWTSRVAFYFAAIGAAVGFGNVWRFPALSFQYGGGAFFIPYIMALLFVGLPIAVLEIGFGQYFQTGDVGVFGGFHPRLRGVGFSSVSCSFMLVTYYSMLIAWVINAFFDSFSDSSPWSEESVEAGAAVGYFMDMVIGGGTVAEDGTPTRTVGKNVGYSFLVWVIIFLCIGFGIKWTGRITYFTMGLPIILLFVFLGRAVSLPGSQEGIQAYIGQWDMSVLSERPDVWSTAVSQVFFSISVTFGILTAFGSYCRRDEPAFINSCVVAFSDGIFSFIAGFAVFAAVGHLSYESGVPVADLPFAGFSLVFGTWPVILSTLPGGIHWVRLLFFNLFLLGIDSAFAMVEAGVVVFHDTVALQNTPKWKIVGLMCIIGWLFSLIYATDAGLSFLDVIDFYINFTMLIVGFFETFAAGWVYGIKESIATLGAPAVFSYMGANFVAVIVSCAVWFSTYSVWGGFVALIGVWCLGVAVTMFFLAKVKATSPEWTWSKLIWAVSFKNIVDLKNRIEPTIRYIPWIWCVLVKQFIPHVLIILFVNLASTRTALGRPLFSGYGDYSVTPYQVLGVLTFVFASFLFLVGMIFPGFYSAFALPPGHHALEFINEEPTKTVDGMGKDVNDDDGDDEANEPAMAAEAEVIEDGK